MMFYELIRLKKISGLLVRSVHEITSAVGEEFLFRFKAHSVAHSQLRNTLCNAEAGQKDESDGDVISCTFLSAYLVIGLMLGFVFPQMSLAEVAPAGTQIVNQASIRFVDTGGEIRTVTTNEVFLLVRQVYSSTLSEDRTREGAASKTVVFYHSLTNTGNGTESYTLRIENDTVVADSGDFTGTLRLYKDANGNGQVDGGDIEIANTDVLLLGSLTLESAEVVQLIAQAVIPAGAADGETYGLTVKAISSLGTVSDLTTAQGLDALNETNEDVVSVTSNAVLEVYKQSTYNNQATASADDDTLDYTVTIFNNGLSPARDIIVTDALPTNTTFNSVTGFTGDWVGAVGDDGANGSDGAVPTHDAGVPGNMAGEVDVLAIAGSVSVTFRLDIDNGLAGGSSISNIALAQGDLDNNIVSIETQVQSNQVFSRSSATYGVTIEDTAENTGGDGINDGQDDDAANDVQLVDTAPRASSVVFTHVVSNTGNQTDVFKLVVAANTFPVETIFQFFSADGETPLLDTDNDGVIDTGQIAAASSRNIIVKVILPETGVGTNGGAGWTATLSATSGGDATQTDTTGEKLDNILGNEGTAGKDVDLANSLVAVGFNDNAVANADPVVVAAPVTTKTAAAGRTVIFDLFVANEGDDKESYALSFGSDAAVTTPLPANWKVIFKNGDEVISTTDLLDSGGSFAFTAEVKIPQDEVPADYPIYFKALGNNNQTFDIKYDQVTVSNGPLISLAPNGGGVIPPCGSTDYLHVLTNSGNTTETIKISAVQSLLQHVLLISITNDGSEPTGFVPKQEFIVGNNFTYQAEDGTFSTRALASDGAGGVAFVLAPGDFTWIQARVLAACSVAEQSKDVLTITATSLTTGGLSVEVIDQTTVRSVYLTVVKSGALDAACDGTADTAFASAQVGAEPNQCVIWKLETVNKGVKNTCNVSIRDAAPAFTVLESDVNVTSPVVISQPAPGVANGCSINGGEIVCNAGNSIGGNNFCLKSGERVEVQFRVRVE